MAKAFVRQLPRIPGYALPSDASCPICVQLYENLTFDSGTFEKAVALPCSDKHIFGSDCLTEWLAYGKNCPFCRSTVTLPNVAARQRMDAAMDRITKAVTYATLSTQIWDDYWYGIFWILHQNGDRAVEQSWRQWQEDMIWAADEYDPGCQARAKAALSISPLMTGARAEDPVQIRASAAAIQTLRFREYLLFLRFQEDAGEHPELKAPPAFQLTAAQEDTLLQELDRRQAFRQVFSQIPGASIRKQWNLMRDLGFVWDPDWDFFWSSFPGRWSRYVC